jgi:uncharacterized membrane protein
MNSWLDQLHGGSTAFPPAVTAVKLAVALAIGLLIGFERQWSHKDFGVRTFSLTALLGALTAMISTPVMLMGMLATILLAVLLNVRDIVASNSVEGTTSVALVVTFVLGALIGNGHMFTSVACATVATWLLSLKPHSSNLPEVCAGRRSGARFCWGFSASSSGLCSLIVM